jgi:hypothetical protein
VDGQRSLNAVVLNVKDKENEDDVIMGFSVTSGNRYIFWK